MERRSGTGRSTTATLWILGSPACRWALGAVMVVAVALFLVQAQRAWPITVDDAAISMTYARSLAQGAGPVLWAGDQPVEAYSNPGWVGLLALAAALGLPLVAAAKVLGLILGAATLLAFVLLARSLLASSPGPAGRSRRLLELSPAAAALACAGNVAWAVWAVAGLESSLQALLLVLLWERLLAEDRWQGRPWGSALVLILLGLTRPEAPVYGLVAFGFKALRRVPASERPSGWWRRDLGWLGALGLSAALLLLLRWLTFAEWFPNSYLIKKISFSFDPLGWLNLAGPGWRYLGSFLQRHLLWAPVVLAPAALALPGRRVALLPGLGLLLAGTYFVLYSGGDWMPEHRFLAPLLPLLFGCAAWSSAALLERALRRSAMPRGLLPVLVLVASLAFAATSNLSSLERRRDLRPEAFTGYEQVSARGRYFALAAQRSGVRQASLLDPDLGGTSLDSGLRLFDLFGLGDRMLPRYRWEQPLVREYLLHELRPDFVHLHGAWLSAYWLQEYPELQRDYLRLPARLAPGMEDRGLNFVRREIFASPWAPPPSSAPVDFGDSGLRLVGADLGGAALEPGGTLALDFDLLVSAAQANDLDAMLWLSPWPRSLSAPGPDGHTLAFTVDWLPAESPGGGLLLLAAACRRGGEPGLQPTLTLAGPPQRRLSGQALAASADGTCRWVLRLPAAARAPGASLALEWGGAGAGPASVAIELPAVVAQQRILLGQSLFPPASWLPGESVSVRAELRAPAAASPQRLRLLLGLRRKGRPLATPAGLPVATLGDVELGPDARAAASAALRLAVDEAVVAGRRDRALGALETLQRFDAGAGTAGVERAAARVGADLLTTSASLAQAGDLGVAASLLLRAQSAGAPAAAARAVRRVLLRDLEQAGRQAAAAGDADSAFELLGSALRLAPSRAGLRRLQEAQRDRRSAQTLPYLRERARRVGRAHGLHPSPELRSAVLRELDRAGLDEELLRFCPLHSCGVELGPEDLSLLAGALRRQGYLNAALRALDAGGEAPLPLAAGLLRQDLLAIQGLRPRPGEVRRLLEQLPGAGRQELGGDLALVGLASRRDLHDRLLVQPYFQRTGVSVAGSAGLVELRYEGPDGPGSLSLWRRLPAGRVFALSLPLALRRGEYRIWIHLPGGAAEVDLGRHALDGPSFGFEHGSSEGWQAEGEAFGAPGGVVRGPAPGQQMITGYRGAYLLSSYAAGDRAQGRLLSQPFVLEEEELSFAIGGGKNPDELGVRLLVDDRSVRSATGFGSERMRRVRWDLRPWRGRSARLEVFDRSAGPWGHVLCDDFLLLPRLPDEAEALEAAGG